MISNGGRSYLKQAELWWAERCPDEMISHYLLSAFGAAKAQLIPLPVSRQPEPGPVPEPGPRQSTTHSVTSVASVSP